MRADQVPRLEPARSSWRHRDHTRGSLLASMLVLALPSIGTSIAGAATYQLIELKFVSLLGAIPLAAVVVTNQTLRQGVFVIFIGISITTQMMLAHSIGEGQVGRAERLGGQAILVTGGLCLLLALAGGLFPRELLGLVTGDPEVLAAGAPYLRLVFVLFFGFGLVPILNGILTGSGDTTTPLLITLLAAPASMLAEWCLIFGHLGAPALGLRGAALGAALGSLTGLGIALWVLLTGRCRVHLRPGQLTPDPAAIALLLRISWKPMLHMAGQIAVVFYFMTVAGRFGSQIQAAYGIGIRLQLVVFMVSFPIANACATLVGQNLGAGSPRRAWRSIALAMSMVTAVCGTGGAVLFLFRGSILAAFTSDPVVIAAGKEVLLYLAAGLLMAGPYLVAMRALQGAGDMVTPMLIANGTALLVAIPLGWALALRTSLGPTGLWVTLLVNTVINTALMLACLATGRWTSRRPVAAVPSGT